MASTKVAILGAEGFVGRHLVRAMSDNSAIQVKSLARPKVDLTRPDTFEVIAGNVDCIVHAAGLIDGTREQLFNSNVAHVDALANHCERNSIRSLVYLSTGSVFGADAGIVMAGDPCNPVGPYAESKLEAEQLLRAAFKGRLNILRLFYPYGAGQREPRLLPRLLTAASNGTPVLCGDDGGPRLNLGHVDDLCRIIVDDFIVRQSETVLNNVASDIVMPLKDIFTSICQHVGRTPNLFCAGMKPETVSVPYGKGRWRKFEPFLIES